MSGPVEITDPDEIALIRLYNRYPPEHRPAVARLLQDMADGSPPLDAMRRFGMALGQSADEAWASAERIVGEAG